MEEMMLLFKIYDRLYYEWAKKSGLSDAAFYIMIEIWERDGKCTQAEISTQWSMSKQTVNSALKTLERDGYLKLVPAVAGNRKSVQFTLKGKEYAKKYVEPILRLDDDIWKSLPEEEREVCVRALKEHQRLFIEALNNLT